MRKEILFAIIAGAVFGLVIAFGVWRANVALKPTPSGTASPTSATPTPASKSDEFGITIAKPEKEAVITESPVAITGETTSNAIVVISVAEKDYTLTAGKNGSFEQEVSLGSGLNEIIVTAFNEKGESVENRFLVVYSTEFTKSGPTTPSSNATGSADSIREKVQEKIETALNSPRAYIGTVTDISESTIEIRNLTGEIQQISVNSKDTKFVKIDKTSKEVKLADVAIGDFVVAMGYKNGNSVLNASRVLLTPAFKPSEQKALFATIQKVDSKKETLTVSLANSTDQLTIDASEAEIFDKKNNKLVEIKLVDLETDQNIIIVGIVAGKNVESRFIQLVTSITSPTPTSKPSSGSPSPSASASPKTTATPKATATPTPKP